MAEKAIRREKQHYVKVLSRSCSQSNEGVILIKKHPLRRMGVGHFN